MEADSVRHYVLKGTVCLNGTVYLGGTHWTGHPSSVVKGYIAMSCHGRKMLLEPAIVASCFKEVDTPATSGKESVVHGSV